MKKITHLAEEDVRHYLLISKSTEPASALKLPKAFVDGYLGALHVAHIYSVTMFSPDDATQIQQITDEINGSPNKHLLDTKTIFNLLAPPPDAPKERQKSELCDAFICGYVSALHIHGIYNYALFMDKITQQFRIFGDLFYFYEKERETFGAACQRTVNGYFTEEDII